MIPTVTVTADNNPDYSTNPGNATQDRVFLLSITEVNKYFASDDERKCKPTAYAVANGAYEGASVYYFGTVYEDGHGVYYADGAVRPALWIDLNS